jgi:Arc/MetJ family transcription regulator
MTTTPKRTKIDIDDDLLKSAMRATGLRRPRAVVEEAQRIMIIRGQESILKLRGKIEYVDGLKPSRSSRFSKSCAGSSSSIRSSERLRAKS